MRAVAIIAVALLLSGCTWLRQEAPWSSPAAPSAPVSEPLPKPEPPKPTRPRPHADKPAAAQAPVAPVPPADPAPVDYDARCRTMAANRADDARQLGASAADQAKIQSDTYRDCVAQPATK